MLLGIALFALSFLPPRPRRVRAKQVYSREFVRQAARHGTRSARDGLVALVGRVEARAVVPAPVSGAPCVAWSVEVQELAVSSEQIERTAQGRVVLHLFDRPIESLSDGRH